MKKYFGLIVLLMTAATSFAAESANKGKASACSVGNAVVYCHDMQVTLPGCSVTCMEKSSTPYAHCDAPRYVDAEYCTYVSGYCACNENP